MEVKGDKELIRKLRGLPSALRVRVIRSAIGKSGSALNKRIKAASPVQTGALRKSFGRAEFLNGIRGEIGNIVGVRAGTFTGAGKQKSRTKRPEEYAPIVHRNNPFAEDAFQTSVNGLVRDQKNNIASGLIRLARR